MKHIIVDIKTKEKKIPVWLLGDLHRGHKDCEYNAFLRWRKWAKKVDARVIIMGDMLESVTPSTRPHMIWEQMETPRKQLSIVKKDLRPIKDNIDAVLDGNHEDRVSRLTSFHPGEMLAKSIAPEKDMYLGAIGLITYRVNNKYTYKGVVLHGKGGGVDPRGQLKKAQKIYSAYDFIAIGHIHQLFHEPVVSIQDGFMHTCHLIRTGGFLFYPGYAEAATYAPSHVGSAVLFLGAKRNKIDVDINLDDTYHEEHEVPSIVSKVKKK